MPPQPQTYGQRQSRHWSKCGAVCRMLVLLGVAFFIFFYVYGVVFMPFLNARDKHIASVKEAETYLKSQVCTNREVQAELGQYGLQKCGASHEIAAKDVNREAINDVLRSLNLCKDGECVVMSFNIVTFTIVSVAIILVGTGLGVTLALGWVLYKLWEMWQSDYELPFVGSTRDAVKRAANYEYHHPTRAEPADDDDQRTKFATASQPIDICEKEHFE